MLLPRSWRKWRIRRAFAALPAPPDAKAEALAAQMREAFERLSADTAFSDDDHILLMHLWIAVNGYGLSVFENPANRGNPRLRAFHAASERLTGWIERLV